MRSSPLAFAALAVGAAHGAPALGAHVPALADRLGLIRRVDDPTGIAITFDDGPHPVATPRILEILRRHQARATFFVVGEQVRRRPGLAAEIVAAGHEIALHGETHRCELRLAPQRLREDWARGLEAIEAATGVVAQLRRPPYGACSATSLMVARQAGLQTVLWNRWGRDWTARATPESVAERVLDPAPVAAGIVLLHDADHYGAAGCWRSTVGALPRILERCGEVGLESIAIRAGGVHTVDRARARMSGR